MTLKQLNIKREYRPDDNIVKSFYIPLLRLAQTYDRAVGFFSSTILAEIAIGIQEIARKDGRIRIVASPHLFEEDITAIKRGYEKRDEIIKRNILKNLQTPKNEFEKVHLNLLANLIADNILDIKIAFTEKETSFGMYHEKMGIISDDSGNSVAFSGSLNETLNALSFNYETIDVYCSWKTEDAERVNDKKEAFERIWNDIESNIKIISFPELSSELINKYKVNKVDYQKPEAEIINAQKIGENIFKKFPNHPIIPAGKEPRDYQKKAINSWKDNNYHGIFDMATGTGKTLTGLSALTTLSEALEHKLSVVIVVPYQHLVEQWVEDIVDFQIKPIIGYSDSQQKDWFRRLERAIFNQELNIPGSEFFLFICTNATFATDRVQNALKKIKGNTLLMVDEAHNAGAARFNACLTDQYKYRLALSATIDRHGDKEGTEKLFQFFGDKCITYTLEEAIETKKLTPYYYHPIITTLDPDELEKYYELTHEMSKCIMFHKDGTKGLSERGKRIALKRARLIAGGRQKILALEKAIQPYIHDKHILVYCGATTMLSENADISDTDNEDIRQIEAVSSLLGNKLGMKTARFTSDEGVDERSTLKKEFARGDLQALVAIKCLDEGVNIPAIKTAFILASTTNPKEYIQRRGRVLRKHKDKEFAVIYDFITLPHPIGGVHYLTEAQRKLELTLVKNELKRAEEFARISRNRPEAMKIIEPIKEAYAINEYLLLDLEEEL